MFSKDMFNNLHYEMRDIYPHYDNLLYNFIKSQQYLSKDDISIVLDNIVSEQDIDKVIEDLLWFSFIGLDIGDEILYSYNISYDMKMLKSIIDANPDKPIYHIHPAFHKALSL